MTQSKIISFFRPSAANTDSSAPSLISGGTHLAISSLPPSLDEQKFHVTYTKRDPTRTNHQDQKGWVNEESKNLSTIEDEDRSVEITGSFCFKTEGRGRNKKRTYAQYHLELGQSDFFLYTCSVCRLRYSRGDEEDEKLHKLFHKNYFYGVQFKGWRNERVVVALTNDGERIVLVSNDDPSAHREKVLEVSRIVERDLDLNDGWLLHDLCKIYLFIFKSRVVGLLVAEPIKSAYRVLPSSETAESSQFDRDTKIRKSSSILRFGSINFEREVNRKPSSCVKKRNAATEMNADVIICEDQAVPACCGIRAVWVVPSKRRQRIATHLLDAFRKSFCMGYVIAPSQCAFTQTTSLGRLLACSYTGTKSF